MQDHAVVQLPQGNHNVVYYLPQGAQMPQLNPTTNTVYPQDTPHVSKTYPEYKRRTSMILGSLHIVIGIMVLALNIGAIVVDAFVAVVSYGIWGGIIFIITGSFCIGTARQNNHCMVSTVLAMSIISSMAAVPGLVLSIWGAAYDAGCYYYCGKVEAQVAMHVLISVLLFVELAASIWSSILGGVVCCAGGDCGGSHCESQEQDECCCPVPPQQQQPNPQHVLPQQFTMATVNGQQCLVPTVPPNLNIINSPIITSIPAGAQALSITPQAGTNTIEQEGSTNEAYEHNEGPMDKKEDPPAYSD